MDRVVFVIAATATHQNGHAEQPLYTPVRSMAKAVFASEPNATIARGHQQQPFRKHRHPNGNCEIEATGGLPNSQTSQRIYIRVFLPYLYQVTLRKPDFRKSESKIIVP